MKLLLVLLLAPSVSGVFLRSGSESHTLRAHSEALHNQIQAYADRLELNPADVAHYLTNPGDTVEFLRALRLCAPCKKYQRFGEDNDGGYVMCADGLDKGLVGAYSFGINGFDGWGMAIAERFHIPLNEYDCTSLKKPVACKGCERHFHPQCILHNGGDAEEAAESLRGVSDQRASDNEGNADDASKMTGASFKTFTQILKESGNANVQDRSLLLKIDVESAEWKVFAEEPVETLKKFREIVVEYHWINDEENHHLYAQAVKKVQQAGFSVAHMHGNNWGRGMGEFGEFSIPDVIEVTYIQTPAEGCAANIPYHNKLDMPNTDKRPEMADAVLPTK